MLAMFLKSFFRDLPNLHEIVVPTLLPHYNLAGAIHLDEQGTVMELTLVRAIVR